MVTNEVLYYGGVTPSQALTGTQPPELYDRENQGFSASTGVLQKQPDFIETALRVRLHCKDCTLQAIIEERLAKADKTRVQRHTPEDLARLENGTKIDIWRKIESKSDPVGWRGPAELVRLYKDDGKAIVEWKGWPMLLPLRHIRPHAGFVWLVNQINGMNFSSFLAYLGHTDEEVTTLNQLMDLIDMSAMGIIFLVGKIYSEAQRSF